MKKIAQDLASYINSLEITKVSFGKLFISDPDGDLVFEVTSKGKAAFVTKNALRGFNTTESELLVLLRNKFPHHAISYVILEY